jgi:3-hydroxy-9,10-secoandrosta-1,3,5(10)-triene-9,17-dione monooxygenase reductase component
VVDLPNADDGAIDEARFRQVLGHFPTGVTVITAKGPVGLAVGSFSSISLHPPLVGFFAGKSSSSWPKIRETGHFGVNILAADQEDVCRVFASKAPDKFAGLGWKPMASGAPRLHDVLAWIDCEIDEVYDVGDHDLCVGKVIELAVDIEHEHGPLVFYRGGYGRFEP